MQRSCVIVDEQRSELPWSGVTWNDHYLSSDIQIRGKADALRSGSSLIDKHPALHQRSVSNRAEMMNESDLSTALKMDQIGCYVAFADLEVPLSSDDKNEQHSPGMLCLCLLR